jgi:hypothetical protein
VKGSEPLYLCESNRAEVRLLKMFTSTQTRIRKQDLDKQGDSLNAMKNRANKGIKDGYKGIEDIGFKISSISEKGESCFRIEKVHE